MKTVIVIDTDDAAGMESTRRIVKHLLETYHTIPASERHPFEGKIKAIKTMRNYVVWCKRKYGEEWADHIGSLRAAKDYVEEFEVYKPSGRV
jgi:hypothetical protein